MRTAPTMSAAIILCLLATGCGREQPVSRVEQASPPKLRSEEAGPEESFLRKSIAQSIHDGRLYAPARDNAYELNILLRSLRPQDASAPRALQDLEPYVILGIEQKLQDSDLPEARRLLAMLRTGDSQAVALPRLEALLTKQENVAAAADKAKARSIASLRRAQRTAQSML